MILREYQQEAVVKVRASVAGGNKRVVLVLSTGGGKSLIFSEIIKLARERGNRCLFLVHRRGLVLQMAETIKKHIGCEVGMIMAGHESDTEADVQVGTLQTFSRRLNLDELSCNRFFVDAQVVLIDEAHTAVSKRTKDVLALYQGKVIIGCTATPMRADGRGLGEVFDALVDVASVKELTEGGYLAPVRYFAPATPDLEKIKVVRGDYELAELGKRMNTPKLVGDIVDNWTRIAPGQKTIVFCVNVKHAIAVCEAFNRVGIPTAVLTAKSSDDARESVFRDMDNGNLLVICNVALYIEGMDVPDISCVVMARPTKSLGLYRQACGRGLRPSEGKTCLEKDTLILTDKGLVKIQDVSIDHKVWDGVSYVKHGGSVCKGVKSVISYQGLTATPDHEVKTYEKGWTKFQEAADRRLRIIKSGDGWSPVRVVGDCGERDFGEVGHAEGNSAMRSVRWDFFAFVSQYEEKANNKSLPELQPEDIYRHTAMGLQACSRAKAAMSKGVGYLLCSVRRSWNKVQFFVDSRSLCVDNGKYRGARKQRLAVGEDKQRRTLRAWESAMGNKGKQYEQHETVKREESHVIFKNKGGPSRGEVFRCHTTVVGCQTVRGGDSGEVGKAVLQTKREVWDIHNAGPLHRYTANGLLVHNCLTVIDHGGVIEEHGLLCDEIEWSLDGEKKAWKKKEKQDKEKKPCICRVCSQIFEGRDTCPDCGSPVKSFGKPVEVVEADLEEVGGKKGMSTADRRRFLGMLLFVQQAKGYKQGWVYWKYKERTGKAVRGREKVTPIEPDEKFKRYLQHLNIKAAKSPRRLEA